MSGLTGDIKKLFNFKYKTRNDSASDQFNRLFMCKVMLVAAFLTGMKWYKDEVNCLVKKGFDSSTIAKYGPQACWINGFYVYEELRDKKNFYGYYGIPNNMGHDGIDKNERTCMTKPGNINCKPMKKRFYLQYQWFPFYLAMLAVLYYLPYIAFNMVNNDLLTLKKSIKSQEINVDNVIASHFNSKVNEVSRQNYRVYLNIFLAKPSYLIVNVLAFVFTDSLLNGDYKSFGTKWLDWSKKNNSAAHNYLDLRSTHKPGEVLLPTFGFCDVLELGKDEIFDLENEHRLVCELSQHVLYTYVLMAVWFLLILGMVVSILGWIELIVRYATRSALFAREEAAAHRVYSMLSVRQREYLDFVRKKNVEVYGTLIRKLYNERFGDDSSSEAGNSSRETKNEMESYT